MDDAQSYTWYWDGGWGGLVFRLSRASGSPQLHSVKLHCSLNHHWDLPFHLWLLHPSRNNTSTRFPYSDPSTPHFVTPTSTPQNNHLNRCRVLNPSSRHQNHVAHRKGLAINTNCKWRTFYHISLGVWTPLREDAYSEPVQALGARRRERGWARVAPQSFGQSVLCQYWSLLIVELIFVGTRKNFEGSKVLLCFRPCWSVMRGWCKT